MVNGIDPPEETIGFRFPKPFGDSPPAGASVGQKPAGEWFIALW